ncbi:MAG: CPBP family intramembrane glutamic endopeptidase [Planctomycetota bacterium]
MRLLDHRHSLPRTGDRPEPRIWGELGQLAPRRRRYLTAELLALFVGLPLLVLFARSRGVELAVLPTLVVASALLLTPYYALHRRELGELLALRRTPGEPRRILVLFAVSALTLAGLTRLLWPELFFLLPREHPASWLRVMAIYPVLSVLPQELLFRGFFFSRYGGLFGRRATCIAASACVFGLAHVLFGSWISVVLSALGGVLFGVTYARTRSVWPVALEHTLYGWLLFTTGLGEFFYDGGFAAAG